MRGRGPAFPRRVRAGKLVFRDPLCTCALLYILLYFDGSGFLRLGLLAAALHDGFCMRTAGLRLSPGRRFWLAAAGPGTNALMAAVWCARVSARLTAGDAAFLAANVLTGVFNLLPVPPLDGAQMLGAGWEALTKKLQSAPK